MVSTAQFWTGERWSRSDVHFFSVAAPPAPGAAFFPPPPPVDFGLITTVPWGRRVSGASLVDGCWRRKRAGGGRTSVPILRRHDEAVVVSCGWVSASVEAGVVEKGVSTSCTNV